MARIRFGCLTGRKVKVAIVDSGIAPSHPKVGMVAGGLALSTASNGLVVSARNWADCSGHGTACAGIVRKKAPECEIYSIRIFDQSLSTNERTLTAALEWATTQRMDVVNLSLGSTDVTRREDLREVCRQAEKAGVVVVAAEHNEERESYPAVFPEVIGVSGGWVHGMYDYYYRPGAVIECVARGNYQRVCWLNQREIMIAGTSFAGAHISGIVVLIREAFPGATLEKVREVLQANALPGKPEQSGREGRILPVPAPRDMVRASGSAAGPPCKWVRKAAIYPFNKEMHAFVRFRDLLGFELVGVADPIGKGLVGKDAGEALGIPPAGLSIRPRLAAALQGADTLVLGYVDQLSRIGKKDLLRDAVRIALDHGCHVFSFIAVPREVYADLHDLAAGKGLHLAYPSVDCDEVRNALRSGQNYSPVDVPVVGVFGTSSQQGKFTLQLALRRRLLSLGYKVGQIGTEHHSALFGMDFAFPMGYASPLDLPLQWYVPYLDYKMRQICRQQRPDLMIVGSQSGTIPYDVHEHGAPSMASIAFLLGTKPDACILVVNSIDADRYVGDSIDAIRALAKAPTLILAMSDKEKHIRAAYGRSWVAPRQMRPAEIAAKLGYLENRFGLPAVEIASAQGQRRMAAEIVRYFASSRNADRE